MIEQYDIVRCSVNNEKKSGHLPYCVVLDIINNDEFYGEVQDPYDQGEDEWTFDNLCEFTIIKLSFNCISEIPLDWQTEEKKKILEPYLLDIGYSITGSTIM